MTPEHLRTLLRRFLTAKEAANRSPRTLTWYDEEISHFILWIEGHDIEGDGLPAVIDRYLAEERRRNLAPASVSARFRALSAWFNWCARRDLIEASPIAQVERPRVPKKAQPYVTIDECARLLASIAGSDWTDARDRLIVTLLFWTGLRVGELVALTVEDIDRQAHTVRVRNGKGMKARTVPTHGTVPALLVDYIYARPAYSGPELLVSSDGYAGIRGPITTEGVRQMLIRRCKRARVRYLNPHLFRHGFAMAMLNNGMGMSGVSALMGHASTAVTETVYAHWQTGALQREYQETVARIEARNT